MARKYIEVEDTTGDFFVGSAVGGGGGGSVSGGIATGGIITPSGGSYPYTLTTTDNGRVIRVDTSAARTINAQASPASGFTITFKDHVGSAATNPATFVRNGSQTIASVSGNYSMDVDYGTWSFIFTGSDWTLL